MEKRKNLIIAAAMLLLSGSFLVRELCEPSGLTGFITGVMIGLSIGLSLLYVLIYNGKWEAIRSWKKNALKKGA